MQSNVPPPVRIDVRNIISKHITAIDVSEDKKKKKNLHIRKLNYIFDWFQIIGSIETVLNASGDMLLTFQIDSALPCVCSVKDHR